MVSICSGVLPSNCANGVSNQRSDFALLPNVCMFQDWSGALSTAGGVAFYGTLDGWFRAVDLSDGKILYQFHCPSGIVGNPMTFMHRGKQYVSGPDRRWRMGDPGIRKSSSKNSLRLVSALQPWPTALFLGARPSRSAPQSLRAASTPEASFRPFKSTGGAPRIERTSPRVQLLGPCCLSVDEFLRTTAIREAGYSWHPAQRAWQ